MMQIPFREVIPPIAVGIIALLIIGLLLRTLIRGLGLHPSRYSLRIRTARRRGWWTDASFIRGAAESVLRNRRSPLAFVALAALTVTTGVVIDRVTVEIAWSSVSTLWQVHAAVVGLSFVVIVFLLDFVSRSGHVDAVLSHFVETSFVKPVLYLSLIGTVSIGVASLYNTSLPSGLSPDYTVALFVITVLAIIIVYYRIIRMILDESPDDYSYQLLENQITRKVGADARAYHCNRELEDALPEEIDVIHFRYGFGPREVDAITAEDLGAQRYISDIHLRRFRSSVRELYGKLEAADSDSRIVGETVTVRCDVRINQDTDRYPVVLDASQDLSEFDLDGVERNLRRSVLSTSSPPWPTRVDDPYEFVDYLEKEGVQSVRNDEYGSFSEFLGNYRDLMHHGLDELIEKPFLFQNSVYFELESPLYSLERIPVSVFEECLRTRDRKQALETVSVVTELTHRSLDHDLLGPFRNFTTIYLSYIFDLSMRRPNLPRVFQLGITEQILEVLRTIFRDAVVRDCEEIDSLSSDRSREASFSFGLLRQLQEMLKYTLDVKDSRGFMRVWEVPGVPRSVARTAVGDQLQREIDHLLFSAGSLSYTVAKEDDDHRKVFETLYNRKLRQRYRRLADLSEVFFGLLSSDRNPPRWTKWSTREHDVIQGAHGRPVFLRNELTEFYCFLGIVSVDDPEFQDENPIRDESISRSDYDSLRFTVRDLVRRMELFDVDEFLDEETVEERSEKFLEYHEEIVDEHVENQIS